MSATTPKLLTAEGVRQHFSIPRSTLYALMRAEGFPHPLNLTARRVAWRSADIEEWIKQRSAALSGGAK